ncbi:hypothetical protein DSO57_1012024 [Entomophthora muscae]|uniref:Uncharacterized protein n=2 Tax=Entomophthora muscae TaxID=34485 RepID=A0ACC2UR48_9FUNG|nr:hypothetical protein DSO57_1020054 [Entomophthora muscae]KAJ9089528.1 hypothetical protein DSO57_1012024 [Entomophthora muscae]
MSKIPQELSQSRRGIQALAKATTSCKESGAFYGNCVKVHFYEISRGVCQEEFLKFKDCVQTMMKRRW